MATGPGDEATIGLGPDTPSGTARRARSTLLKDAEMDICEGEVATPPNPAQNGRCARDNTPASSDIITAEELPNLNATQPDKNSRKPETTSDILGGVASDRLQHISRKHDVIKAFADAFDETAK
ncbi:hypothetical protein FNYG_13446 [Fusarium nygamai]|uniref:Uncharacterized protein n=1 Tax=Gibberella nygamai TaxID=42673 RepID=A0A2K0VT72_GIBNY|nr:hypothetical protein FNYG_13446 [Fusarium nygamai]